MAPHRTLTALALGSSRVASHCVRSGLTPGRMIASDFPIRRREDDRLGRAALVDHLQRMLIEGRGESRKATELTIGLTGPWGSGKSSIIRLLTNQLSSLANVFVVEFNPWIFQGRDDLLDAFLEELRTQLGSTGADEMRAMLKALGRYRDAIEPAVAAAFPGAEIGAKLISSGGEKSALAKRRTLESRLRALKAAVVVVIDELDRIEPEEIRAMARVVKAVGDLPNISYVVGFDRSRVERALGDGNVSEGAAYLEKVIQFSIPIRPLMTDEVRELLYEGLAQAGYQQISGDHTLEEEAFDHLWRLLDTPRDVKRLASSFAAMEPMVRGEVHPVDLLCYAAITTIAAAVRDKIADNIDAVVNDPADITVRMKRGRDEGHPTVEQIFGDDTSPKVSKLLTFLFPVLDQHGTTDQERFGRIQDRRNLLTMLYLGDPPFQASHKEIAAFWENPDPAMLSKRRKEGTLTDFLGQVYRLLPGLPSNGDVNAWLALASEVGRGSDSTRASGRSVGRELREIIVEFGARGEDETARAQAIVAALVGAGDMALTPDVIRYHMFAHGLVRDVVARGGPTIYDRNETEALLGQELPRYREWIVSGRWLDRSQDADPLFAIEQAGHWDKSLRESAVRQLRDPSALAAFCALMLPPGWSMGAGTIERFVPEKLVSASLAKMPRPEDSWLAACVDRVVRHLGGEDSRFM